MLIYGRHRCIDFVSAIGDLQLCDLDTLRRLNSSFGRETITGNQQTTSVLLDHILPSMKTLSVNLRLPLATCQVFETPTSSEALQPNLSAWTNLPRTISHLPNLNRLHIWLDHSDPSSWSLVNERAILSPLLSLQNIRISINLPKLHPNHESSERHFIDDCPFPIHRRYRQRSFAVNQVRNGVTTVEYQARPDFPTVPDAPDFFMEMMNDDWRNGVVDEVALEACRVEWEQTEREMILRGEDPKRYLDGLNNIVCTVGYV